MGQADENAPAAGNGRGAKQIYNPAGLQQHITSEDSRFANIPPDRTIRLMALQLAKKMTVFSDWPRESDEQ